MNSGKRCILTSLTSFTKIPLCATRVTDLFRKIKTEMTSQSGFLDSFLKFLEGDETGPMTKAAATKRRVLTSKKEETNPPDKVKRRPGRPRKTPKVSNKKEKEKLNCESEESFTEKTNDFEASVDSDSQNVNQNKMLEVLRENFNKCSNEKVGSEETNGEGNVVEKKDFECINEGKKQNGESISEVIEDPECKAENNEANLAMKSVERNSSVDETSECSEKEISNSEKDISNCEKDISNCEKDISNLTDKDETVTNNSASEKNDGRGRKRKKKPDVQEDTPRRELSARKAKRKAKFSYIDSETEDNPGFGFDEESNSDNDPVWTPTEKKISSDEEDNFEWKQRQNLFLKSKKFTPGTAKNHLKPNVEETREGMDSGKSPPATRSEDNDPVVPNQSLVPFQSGSFIALKQELEDLEEPTLWRVDGKALLQKYEPFRSEDGSLRYRNVSTYSGWGPKNRDLYQPVPVRFLYQNRYEYIVEIIKEELIINEDKLREKLVKDLEKHSYAYEVFLQTLVSQALDSNFLNEIVAEKDDYFLSSMDEMDSVCKEKKKKLQKVFGWSEQLRESLCKWPKIISKSKKKEDPEANCEVCHKFSYNSSVDLCGEAYSNLNLECISSDSGSEEFKTFLACKSCLENILLYNKIAHLKHHTYEICVELVKEKESSNESNDNTKILHDILADGPYITKKFRDVSLLWAEADLKSRKKKTEEISAL